MIVDTHIHTRFSTDSTMTLDQALGRAKDLDIGITLTEHMDLAYPEQNAFIFDVDHYFATYEPYRNSKLMLGIEIGMREDCLSENRSIVNNHSFDYVLGSIHVIDNIDIYQDIFYLERTKQEVYSQYFNSMAECLKTYDFIDSLGHIDYICRYAKYNDTELYYREFQESIDSVLKILAKQDKAIEINTRRLSNSTTIDALLPIYKRFYELGGRYATIGSDAHKPADIGRDLNVAAQLAQLCNLKLVYFNNRLPQYIK
ncbi:histidinol-phosphatase [Sporomusaceae bacterium FL31]|nr:histidinol-phosphatase [Sporomusaceae bacterium FL31]GCE33546.1 histidinol-phosphatase [Sporomusaceae bacterium]